MFPLMLIAGCATAAAAEAPPVRHPNLLLNREEIEEVKAKIRQHPWAARLLERTREMAKEGRNVREAALAYVLTGERGYADRARRELLGTARSMMPTYEKLDLKLQPEFGAWTSWSTYAWAYDLTHETFSDEERQQVERWLRTACKVVIEGDKLWTTTPNLIFGKHFNVALVGYCLGDKELIEWGLNDPGTHGPQRGGFYPVLDSMINDGCFWGETPIYALHYDVHAMLALAEAARHYDGTDLYHYVSKKSGGSIKSLLDGYIRMGYPLERTGIGAGAIRMATYGDGSTSYSPSGTLLETYLAPGDLFCGNLEIAYKRYRDPAYAWLLRFNENRDANVTYGRAVWGLLALTHGEPLPENPTPPPAPSGVYPSQGFAFLRADESPAYWTSGALAALVMLGKPIGHGHNDFYGLVLHGKGRLLYPDLNVIQYEPTHLRWTHGGIGHSTLLVDQQSPEGGPFTTRQEFGPDLKFFAIEGSAFKGVDQSRTLLLTKEYLADVFHAADRNGDARVFDWVLHGLGRLFPGNPAAYRPTHALVPFYWWVDNERDREVDGLWRMDWIQSSAGVTRPVGRANLHAGQPPFGDAWFEASVGVRMTMLGAKGTEVFCGDGPLTDGPPYHRIEGNPEGSSPLVVARRRAQSASYAAVHEPYDGRPAIREVRRIAETAKAVALAVRTPSFTDYLMVAFDGKEHALAAPTGEAFAFGNYGFVRVHGDAVAISGDVKGFAIKADALDLKAQATAGGKSMPLVRQGGFVRFGSVPEGIPPSPGEPDKADPIEEGGWLHAWTQPEELHLPATGEKREGEAEFRVRCVGGDTAQGAFRIVAPKGLTASPERLDIPVLREGNEWTTRVKVRAVPDAENALHQVRFVPGPRTPAAGQSLPVSVGVVMTLDRRLPRLSQQVVRAPGYTFAVDEFSGVSNFILDADGHRRHGRMHGTNFIYGIPGVMRDGKFCFQYRHPCRFVWTRKDGLTVGCDGNYNDHDARLGYTFREDDLSIALIPPTNPTMEHTVWLGNFDSLGEPRRIEPKLPPGQTAARDWFFYPHPAYRQGLLLGLPPKAAPKYVGTAVNFPLRAGQEVLLRFASESELSTLLKQGGLK
jgi:hypothetical protein